jgi:hypothetical protein
MPGAGEEINIAASFLIIKTERRKEGYKMIPVQFWTDSQDT